MTNQLAPHQQAILSNLEVLVNLLKDAARISEEGLEYAQRGEQNTVVGGLMMIENSLETSKGLYDAIIALHRAYPQNQGGHRHD